jgi:hypothetical protein
MKNGRRLLSGLHDNTSVKKLEIILDGDVMEGRTGGDIISTLMQNNSSLKMLWCQNLNLGVQGARALHLGLRTNQTLKSLVLFNCRLGDEGVAAIVQGLDGNNTITGIGLGCNHITSNGLRHVTSLLQEHRSVNVTHINVSHNPGLFDDQENTRRFASTIHNTAVKKLYMNCCRMPRDTMTSLFGAVAAHKDLLYFRAYDHVRLEGQDVERLLKLIPNISNIFHLSVNLDFTHPSVLAAFHRNTSIQHLSVYTVHIKKRITNGAVFASLDRNRRLAKGNMLLDSEPRQVIPLGLWSKAIEELTRDDNNNTGATAVYKILQEKLVMWWSPTNVIVTRQLGTTTLGDGGATVEDPMEQPPPQKQSRHV